MAGSPTAAAAAAVRAQVHELGSPTGAREAARRLEHFQRAEGAVQVCSLLLQEALQAQDTNLAFFAALTVAERARMPSEGEAPVAADLCSTLRAGALCQARLPGVVVRQLAAAHARLALCLGDAWPAAIDEALALPCGPDASPLTEVLRALAEESLNRRCPVSPSQRARFVAAARDRTADVMRALGRAAEAQPGAKPLQAAAVWLRAQPLFEERLPMVSHSEGTHASLRAFAPLLPLAARAARLELDLEAFGAAAEALEAVLGLTTDLSEGCASEVVVPLLSAFGAALGRLLPRTSEGTAAELRDVYTVLASAVRAACTSTAVIRCPRLWTEVVDMAMQLLAVAGLSGALMQQGDGGLLDDLLRTLEDTATSFFEATEQAGREGEQAYLAQAEAAMAAALGKLIELLPAALALPPTLERVPEEWELADLRRRASLALLAWCGGGRGQAPEAAATAALQRLERLLSRLPPPGQDVGPRWADVEVALWFATSAAEAVYRGSVRSDGAVAVPELLARLLAGLPSLPRSGVSPARWVLILASASDFVRAADPWLTPERMPLSSEVGQKLLAFLFDAASGAESPAAASEALCVAITNLSPALAATPAIGEALLHRVVALILAPELPLRRRERLVQCALGPLLTLLEPARLDAVFQELLAAMRAAAAPPRGAVPSACPGAACSLLFRALGGCPQQPGAEGLQLRCFSEHWPWFEAALTAWVPTDAIASAVCETLVEALGGAWAHPGAQEAVLRAASLLRDAVARSRTAPALTVPALSALTSLVHSLRGGPAEGAVAAGLASSALGAAGALLGAAADGPLPADAAAALPELLAATLAPGRSAAALCVLQQPAALSSALLAIAAALPQLTCPRAMCWSLRLFARLPHWLQQGHTSGPSAAVFQAALPFLARAWCQLAAGSPVAREPEVLRELVVAMREASRACPGAVSLAVAQALAEGGIGAGSQEPLPRQLSDGGSSEESLAEVLRDSVDAWQTQGMRRQLCAHCHGARVRHPRAQDGALAMVRAVNAVGVGPWEQQTFATSTPPEAPDSLRRTARSPGTISLEWHLEDPDGAPVTACEAQVLGALGWQEAAFEGGGAPLQLPQPWGAWRCTVSALSIGTEYDLRVRGVNEAGCGAWGRGRFGTSELPAAPRRISRALRGASTLRLEWELADPEGAPVESCELHVMGALGALTWACASTKDAAGPRRARGSTWCADVVGLTGNTEYTFRARGCSAGGCGAWSEACAFWTSELPGEPTSGRCASRATASDQLGLEWRIPDPEGAEVLSCEVEVATTLSWRRPQFLPNGEPRRGDGGQWSAAVAGLSADTDYTFRARGRNASGAGGWGPPFAGRTSGAPPQPVEDG
ncbi:unnamed protein product [Prorocentrum cordatum]|uniref:Fibronectin type-III domain-containing protein n=1 Tax=Prorocentrum cordatum TaxID=2364126 RepID=A0ABN9V2G6_9DINO|nr:unnamed protein product [Polarella glacialis]